MSRPADLVAAAHTTLSYCARFFTGKRDLIELTPEARAAGANLYAIARGIHTDDSNRDLFCIASRLKRPLAEGIRPTTIRDFAHAIARELERAAERGELAQDAMETLFGQLYDATAFARA